MPVIVRLCCLGLLAAACAGAPEGEGVSRPDAVAGTAAPSRLRAAVAEGMLVAAPAEGPSWRAFLRPDGTARRLGDGASGSWQVDGNGRLCTRFADGRSCWRIVRDGGSEPAFRGDAPGARARLARAPSEL